MTPSGSIPSGPPWSLSLELLGSCWLKHNSKKNYIYSSPYRSEQCVIPAKERVTVDLVTPSVAFHRAELRWAHVSNSRSWPAPLQKMSVYVTADGLQPCGGWGQKSGERRLKMWRAGVSSLSISHHEALPPAVLGNMSDNWACSARGGFSTGLGPTATWAFLSPPTHTTEPFGHVLIRFSYLTSKSI